MPLLIQNNLSPCLTFSLVHCSHVTYLAYRDTACQSSELVCRHLSLSCLLYFSVRLRAYISCQLSNQGAPISWPQNLMPCTAPGTWNGLITNHYQQTYGANINKQVGKLPIKTGWRDASLAFCKIAKAFKHNTICDSNGIQTYNYLVRKRTINHFAKLTK